MIGENGKLYASGAGFRDGVCYTFDKWPWTEAMMKALCKIKAITPEQRDWHIAGCRERAREKSMKHNAAMLQSAATELGVPLTKKARDAIDRWTS